MIKATTDLDKWNIIIDEFFRYFSDSTPNYYKVEHFDPEGKGLECIEELPKSFEKCRGYDLAFEEYWELIEKNLPKKIECNSTLLFSYDLRDGQGWSSVYFYRIGNRGFCYCEIALLEPSVSRIFTINNGSSNFNLNEIALQCINEDDLPWISVFSLKVNKKHVSINAIINEIRKTESIEWDKIAIQLTYADKEKLKKRLTSEEINEVEKIDMNNINSSTFDRNLIYEIYLKCLEE